MSIPSYQKVMLPLLQLASDGKEHRFGTAVEELSEHFQLTKDERDEMQPSGAQAVFNNRVGWARTYLKKAGLLESDKRGYFNISDEGLRLLSIGPEKIDNSLLSKYPSFVEFKTLRKKTKDDRGAFHAEVGSDEESPEDALSSAYISLRGSLESEILSAVMEASPTFFERLVVDLLVKMGYGGNRLDAGKALGKSGDGGIDGIIKEDQLGLDVIYIQAKRWEGTVGRPEIQKFAGALQGQRAKKGVFITTSNYSKGAIEYAGNIDSKIILIDGDRLSGLLADFNVGVTTVGNYEVKKVDTDYFIEE